MWLCRLLLISLAVGAAGGCARQPVPPSYAQAGYPVAAAPLPQVIPSAQHARVPVPAPRPVGSYQVAQYPPPPAQPIAAPQFAPAMLPELPYTLGAGDRLRVVVFGQEGLTNLYAVDANGNITMPLIGLVPAQGATTQQLAGAISSRLRQGFIREPSVAVEVEIYRPFFILGEVVFPGQYPFVANMTAETAVAIAGGFTPRAKKSLVDLTRPFTPQALRATVPLHTPVRPGDTIYVAERWF